MNRLIIGVRVLDPSPIKGSDHQGVRVLDPLGTVPGLDLPALGFVALLAIGT